MSGITARLTTNGLKEGYLVNCATIYGIVIQANKVGSTTILKYIADFENNSTHFLKCHGKYPADLALNAVIVNM